MGVPVFVFVFSFQSSQCIYIYIWIVNRSGLGPSWVKDIACSGERKMQTAWSRELMFKTKMLHKKQDYNECINIIDPMMIYLGFLWTCSLRPLDIDICTFTLCPCPGWLGGGPGWGLKKAYVAGPKSITAFRVACLGCIWDKLRARSPAAGGGAGSSENWIPFFIPARRLEDQPSQRAGLKNLFRPDKGNQEGKSVKTT